MPIRLDEYRERRPECRLRDWLMVCRHSECADRRDKVFALLSIATDIRGRIVTDYSKPWSKVYCDVMKLYSPYHGLEDRSFVYNMLFTSSMAKSLPYGANQEASEEMAEFKGAVWVAGVIVGKVDHVDREELHSTRPSQIKWPAWFTGMFRRVWSVKDMWPHRRRE